MTAKSAFFEIPAITPDMAVVIEAETTMFQGCVSNSFLHFRNVTKKPARRRSFSANSSHRKYRKEKNGNSINVLMFRNKSSDTHKDALILADDYAVLWMDRIFGGISNMNRTPLRDEDPLLTVGSAYHQLKCCRPCLYHNLPEGCNFSASCSYCHHHHTREDPPVRIMSRIPLMTLHMSRQPLQLDSRLQPNAKACAAMCGGLCVLSVKKQKDSQYINGVWVPPVRATNTSLAHQDEESTVDAKVAAHHTAHSVLYMLLQTQQPSVVHHPAVPSWPSWPARILHTPPKLPMLPCAPPVPYPLQSTPPLALGYPECYPPVRDNAPFDNFPYGAQLPLQSFTSTPQRLHAVWPATAGSIQKRQTAVQPMQLRPQVDRHHSGRSSDHFRISTNSSPSQHYNHHQQARPMRRGRKDITVSTEPIHSVPAAPPYADGRVCDSVAYNEHESNSNAPPSMNSADNDVDRLEWKRKGSRQPRGHSSYKRRYATNNTSGTISSNPVGPLNERRIYGDGFYECSDRYGEVGNNTAPTVHQPNASRQFFPALSTTDDFNSPSHQTATRQLVSPVSRTGGHPQQHVHHFNDGHGDPLPKRASDQGGNYVRGETTFNSYCLNSRPPPPPRLQKGNPAVVGR